MHRKNIELEEKMVLSQKHQPRSHSTQAEIARELILIINQCPV